MARSKKMGGLPCSKCGAMIRHMSDSRLVGKSRVRDYPPCPSCGWKPPSTIESFDSSKNVQVEEILKGLDTAIQLAQNHFERLKKQTRRGTLHS